MTSGPTPKATNANHKLMLHQLLLSHVYPSLSAKLFKLSYFWSDVNQPDNKGSLTACHSSSPVTGEEIYCTFDHFA